MSLIVHTHHSRVVLSITDAASVAILKQEIDDFVSRVREGDNFSIEIAMSSGHRVAASRPAVGSCGDVSEALRAFEDALGSRRLRSYLKEKGLSRSSWYNWKSGTPIKRASLEKLIEIAPNQAVRDLLIAARK
jgi:hypothetical protein